MVYAAFTRPTCSWGFFVCFHHPLNNLLQQTLKLPCSQEPVKRIRDQASESRRCSNFTHYYYHSLISFNSISNHCSKTAGTGLPVSLQYRLNNKNRLALKRCSKTARRKSLHSEGGGEFRLQEHFVSFVSFHLRSPNASCLARFQDDALSLSQLLFRLTFPS